MKMNELVSIIGNGVTYVLAGLQGDSTLQIIEFIFSAILTCVILAYRIWKWWREAKKDGKITDDELDELGNIIEDETKGKGDKK